MIILCVTKFGIIHVTMPRSMQQVLPLLRCPNMAYMCDFLSRFTFSVSTAAHN